jgi:predicted transcriptional regulator
MSLASIGKPKSYDVWNKGKTRLRIDPYLIKEIKNLNRAGVIQKDIAEMKKLSPSCISRIIRGYYDNKIIIQNEV